MEAGAVTDRCRPRGSKHAFVGTVGRDREGDLLLETMRTEGIDVAAVTRVDEPTGTTREPSMPTYEEIDLRTGQ